MSFRCAANFVGRLHKIFAGILAYSKEILGNMTTKSVVKINDIGFYRCPKLGMELPEELEDISDTLTAWESNLRYDPFINFSDKKYTAAKNIYCVLFDCLKYEMSLIKPIE